MNNYEIYDKIQKIGFRVKDNNIENFIVIGYDIDKSIYKAYMFDNNENIIDIPINEVNFYRACFEEVIKGLYLRIKELIFKGNLDKDINLNNLNKIFNYIIPKCISSTNYKEIATEYIKNLKRLYNFLSLDIENRIYISLDPNISRAGIYYVSKCYIDKDGSIKVIYYDYLNIKTKNVFVLKDFNDLDTLKDKYLDVLHNIEFLRSLSITSFFKDIDTKTTFTTLFKNLLTSIQSDSLIKVMNIDHYNKYLKNVINQITENDLDDISNY